MTLYDFPVITFTAPHVICHEEKRSGVPCYDAPKNARIIFADLGADKTILLVCETVDGSTIEDPPSIIAQVYLAEDSKVEVECSSSLLKVRFILKTQIFHLVFSEVSEFWDVNRIVAETQMKRIGNQAKEEELVRGVFCMVPSVPREIKQEEE